MGKYKRRHKGHTYQDAGMVRDQIDASFASFMEEHNACVKAVAEESREAEDFAERYLMKMRRALKI